MIKQIKLGDGRVLHYKASALKLFIQSLTRKTKKKCQKA